MISFNVHETFQSTLQGEGFHAGRACDFIRLYGCPVGCFFCDTGYKSPDGEYYKKQLPKISKTIPDLLKELKSKLVVISGGEPYIHKNLPLLIDCILRTGRDVAVETSGSYWLDVPRRTFITLSPKEHISPKFPVKPQFWLRADEVKIVISDGTELDYYRPKMKLFLGHKYLQPEYFDHSNTVQKVINLVQKNPDFKLSLQTHKILNIQ